MKVYNLTKHKMTKDQLSQAGIDVPAAQQANHLQDFKTMPTNAELNKRADALMALAEEAGAKHGDSVMLAGAMYFVRPLIDAAQAHGFNPVFSFTQRVSVETPQADGSVKLEYVFKHEGWIKA